MPSYTTTLEPVGDVLIVVPPKPPEQTKGGIWIPTAYSMKCKPCNGTGEVTNMEKLEAQIIEPEEFWYQVLCGKQTSQCPRCDGTGQLENKVQPGRTNILAEVVAVGTGTRMKKGRLRPIPVKPGDTVAVAFWAGRTASGSRILEAPRYGLPEGSIICHEYEVVGVIPAVSV